VATPPPGRPAAGPSAAPACAPTGALRTAVGASAPGRDCNPERPR
jgi:hypothetical protein